MANKITLAELLAGLGGYTAQGPIEAREQEVVTKLLCDSRQVEAGSVFVAVKGPIVDGHDYIGEAAKRGALAIVSERQVEGTACVVVPDTRAALGRLAGVFYGWPGKAMKKVAVTGTNGKTTFCYILRSILKAAGHSSAMFGTTGHMIGDEFVPAKNTTPGVLELAELMSRAKAKGINYAILEASSHALDQGRLGEMDFEVGVFTNLSGDHLDYHGSMEEYFEAKAGLFEKLGSKALAVLNRADPASEKLAKRTLAKKLWYGLGTGASIRARRLSSNPQGSTFVLDCAGEELEVFSRLPGTHNVVNALAAAAAGWALGIELEVIAEGIRRLKAVPGRLERVSWDGPFQVLVDYAHTHDALANVLRAVRAITKRKLIVVFGCGGDRDRSKRPKMAEQASALADRIFVTSDNPRTEEPEEIIKQIMVGVSKTARKHTQAISDRREAIHAALASADAGDVVLLAGKGHETYQIVESERRPFDDRVVAAEWLKKKGLSREA